MNHTRRSNYSDSGVSAWDFTVRRFAVWTVAIWAALLLPALTPTVARSFPIVFTDSSGHEKTIARPPGRVVSLVPSISEMIIALGAESLLKGATHHCSEMLTGSDTAIVGGFFTPSAERIASLNPDIVFLTDLQQPVREKISLPDACFVFMKTGSLAQSLEQIRLLGKLLEKDQAAEALVTSIREDLALIAAKVETIPEENRRRVIRIMGIESVMTPGADSFQNEIIRAAGGLTHNLKKTGDVVNINRDQWRRFNPQFIYGCGMDRVLAEKFFILPGWQEAAAVSTGNIRYYPCDLTCRAATRTGAFVSWLAADIYADEFSRAEHLVLPEKIIDSQPPAGNVHSPGDLPGYPDYIDNSRVVRSRIYDFVHKTLIVDFKTPMTVLSSLDGRRDNISAAGNHYFPPPCWSISHNLGLPAFREHVQQVLGRDPARTALLFTGADMDHLAIATAAHQDLTVWALVTAGVAGNALRLSKDSGFYHEPGTINILLLTNREMTPRAMTRAMITVTEAKTAALLDLDIRSSQSPVHYRATGTGTDNVIVVQGAGPKIDQAGGHTRLGELIARAVHDGVTRAVKGRNNLTAGRSIFRRLSERDLTIGNIIGRAQCPCTGQESEAAAALEQILLDSRYAGFIELALAVSDDFEKGLLHDLSAFNTLADQVCRDISGGRADGFSLMIYDETIPEVLQTAFNALLTAITANMNSDTP